MTALINSHTYTVAVVRIAPVMCRAAALCTHVSFQMRPIDPVVLLDLVPQVMGVRKMSAVYSIFGITTALYSYLT